MLNVLNLYFISIFLYYVLLHFFSIPADLRSLSYFYGIMNGGEKEWEFAFKQYKNTTLATERIKLLYGMSAIQEPWMIERYFFSFTRNL